MQEAVFELNTEYGTFKMWISNDININYETRKQRITGKTLALGAKNKCVYIKIPNSGDTAHLHNVKTSDGGCEVHDALIKGEKTVAMINLAFNIIKLSKPHIKYVTLDDRSAFQCYMGDNKYIGVSLNEYNFLFHQKTWYEQKFGAYLQDTKLNNEYIAKKENFIKPKPTDFHYFNNNELDMHLKSLYKITPDWKTFLDIVHKLDNPCRVILPWYKSAVLKILGSETYFEKTWIIDLYKIPKNKDDPYIPDIKFTGIKIKGGSYMNKTRGNKYKYSNKIIKQNTSSRDELNNIKYSKKDIQQIIDLTNKTFGTNIQYTYKLHNNITCKNITCKNKNKKIKNKTSKYIYYNDSLYSSCYEDLYNMKFTKKELEQIINVSKEYYNSL